ncbi:hypothetical protein ACS0TY_003525 [Phlomoides rotata]
MGGLVPVSSLSNKKRKAELRHIENINLVAPPPEPTICRDYTLFFSNADREGVLCPKNDALVISAKILGITVDRILIDKGCYCNIIFKSALDKMGNFTNFVKPYEIQLKGFGDTLTTAYGTIKLAVELVCYQHEKVRITRPLDFVIIDQPNIYNGFFGRSFLETFEATASAFFYCIKFPTSEGVVGTMKGDQKMARKCLGYECLNLFSAPSSALASDNVFVTNELASTEPSIRHNPKSKRPLKRRSRLLKSMMTSSPDWVSNQH